MKDAKLIPNGELMASEDLAPSATVLCAEARPALRVCYSEVLTNSGYDVTTVASGYKAWKAFQSGNFDLLMIGDQEPRFSPARLVLRIREAGMVQPIIIAASDTEFFTDRHNRWLQVTVLTKPFTPWELTETVGRLICTAHHHGWGEAMTSAEAPHTGESFRRDCRSFGINE